MAPRYRNVEAAYVRNQLAQTQRRQDHRPPHWGALSRLPTRHSVESAIPESQWPRMTYHNLSKVMVSDDKRVAVLPNFVSLFFFSFFFFLLPFSCFLFPFYNEFSSVRYHNLS